MFRSFLAVLIIGSFAVNGWSQDQGSQEKEIVVLDENGDEVQIFKDYKWLISLVDHKDCQGKSITVHNSKNGAEKYVVISSPDGRIMYDANGGVWCTDSDELDCKSFYELQAKTDTWTCK